MSTLRSNQRFGVVALAIALITLIPACREPTAQRIVALTGQAMAGAGRIEDLHTLRIRMVYPDHEYPVVTEISRPHRMRTEGVGRYVLVFDGERGAFLERPPAEDGTPQGPGLIEAKYLKDLELDMAFAFPAFFDHPSEYLGSEVAEGVTTHKLRVTLPRGIRPIYFIDAASYLPIKVVADVTVEGTKYHPGRVFSDYEHQGGITYPRRIRYWWVAEKVDTAVVELVEANVPLEEGRFTIPPDIR